MYGNCLVTAAPQGRKRFGSEPCPAAEGPIDKETLRAVESQTCGTVRESDRNYRPFGQPEGVKTQVWLSKCLTHCRRFTNILKFSYQKFSGSLSKKKEILCNNKNLYSFPCNLY